MQTRILILGSKEYPFGCGTDKIKSGGIESYTWGLAEEFEKKEGVEIAIITRKFENQKSYEKNKNIEVYRVPWTRGFYFRNPSFNIHAFLKAFGLDFDVIIAQGPVAVFFSIILSKFKKAKLIARCAGISASQPQYGGFLRKIFFYLERFVYSGADAVVFGSAEEKKQFKAKLKFLPENNIVISTGVKIPDVKEKCDSGNKIQVCFVGRLLEVKGVEYLISAAGLLEQLVKDKIKILIVGDGPQRRGLKELVKKKYIGRIVEFMGHKSKQECGRIMQESSIFVLPSVSEGLPLALLEAMANRCACIVTNIGLPVEDKKDALVVEAKNPEELKNAIELLANNKKLRDELGRNAFEKVKKDYSWEKAVKKYNDVISRLRVV